MGKPKNVSPGEPELREYLRDWHEGFMVRTVNTLMGDRVWAQYALDELSPRVDALDAGREIRHIHGWLLPDGHWARKLGLDRNWTLGADNVLRPEEPSPGPKFTPPGNRKQPPGNRKQRRRAGWRNGRPE